MEVIYRKTVVEKIQEAIREAHRKNKTIEVINLTTKEWQEFRTELSGSISPRAVRRHGLFGPSYYEAPTPQSYMGVPLKVVAEPCEAGCSY